MRRFAALGLGLLAIATLVGAALFWKTRRDVERALAPAERDTQALQFVAVGPVSVRPPLWGGREVAAVVWSESGLVAAGASGVYQRNGSLDEGLPNLNASALGLWRGRLVVALAAGGVYRRAESGWEEARSGFGVLHVRALAESEAGELLIGAREGLFRAAWAANRLERLDRHPVRSIATAPGFVLAGGEEGLRRISGATAKEIATPDPWIESVGVLDETLFAVTAAGLASGDSALVAVPGGEAVAQGVVAQGRFVGLADTGDALRRFDAGGRFTEELLPSPARRVFAVGDALLADTDAGVRRRDRDGWSVALPTPASLPWPQGHVSALALFEGRLVAGRFDGGLAIGAAKDGSLSFAEVPGAASWGVNALLPAGGAVYVASLRGAARFDGQRLTALEGPGAAFALAATPDGVAIGYAQGVLLPGRKLLSAFHGLPGNQATALAGGASLFVGTPSGLGAVRARRVLWRVTPGEGKLPHPWITALLERPDALYVGTYGGGVARRLGSGQFVPFVETEGVKVAAGALLEAGGRVFLGTEGRGLLRLSRDRERFEPVRVALPSRQVTALAATADVLFVGTDEGLTRVPLAEVSE